MNEIAVVIAGAGPTGLMLAGELALAGVEVTVLERLPEPRVAAMGMAINPTVVELLAQRGIMDSLGEDGMEWRSAHFAHLWLDPERLTERRAYNFVAPQAALERRLEEHAVKLGATVLRGHAVEGLAQDATGVTVGAGGRTLRCRYLVGCDGAGSTVRELAGIGFPGTDSPFYGLVGELDVVYGDPLYRHIGSHEYPAGLFNVTPSGPEVLRVTTGEFKADPPDRTAPVTLGELRERVRHIAGLEIATGTPRWLARWFHATRQADRYRAGRVFLAGDAAHVHFPLGGQALSTDLEDAVNLGWKVAAEVLGWAPPDLLGTYHTERYPVGARACRTTEAQVALLYPLGRVAPVRELLTELIGYDEVNAHLVRLAGGFDVRYPMADPADGGAAPHPLAGTRPAHVPLVTPAGPTDLGALLRPGRGVLLDLTCHPVPAEPTAWRDVVDTAAPWRARIDVVVADPTPELPARLLLRPDGRVAWASDGPVAGLVNALRRWFGAPGEGT